MGAMDRRAKGPPTGAGGGLKGGFSLGGKGGGTNKPPCET